MLNLVEWDLVLNFMPDNFDYFSMYELEDEPSKNGNLNLHFEDWEELPCEPPAIVSLSWVSCRLNSRAQVSEDDMSDFDGGTSSAYDWRPCLWECLGPIFGWLGFSFLDGWWPERQLNATDKALYQTQQDHNRHVECIAKAMKGKQVGREAWWCTRLFKNSLAVINYKWRSAIHLLFYSFVWLPQKDRRRGQCSCFSFFLHSPQKKQGGTSMCSSLLWQLSKSHDNSRDEGHVLLCWLSEWRPCIHLLFLWGKALKLKEWCCNMLQQMILPSAPRSSNVRFVLLRFMVGTHPTIHVDRVRPW